MALRVDKSWGVEGMSGGAVERSAVMRARKVICRVVVVVVD
jgi:hypothetical protein